MPKKPKNVAPPEDADGDDFVDDVMEEETPIGVDDAFEGDPDADLEGDLDDIDLSEDDLDEDDMGLGEDDLGDDDLVDELGEDALVEDDILDVGATLVPSVTGEDDADDDEDVLDPDDVEASLDVILKERLVIEEIELDDDDTPDSGDPSDSASVVIPKRPDEFVCQSCFLVKHPSQLADKQATLCRDCV
jgi:Domain of unknown function (DUF4193)